MLKKVEKKFIDIKNVLTSGTHIKNIEDKVDNGHTV
jgi:hypothetical protein